MRRAAFASRHRFASRRGSTAPGAFRVTATVMAPLRRSATPPINARGPRVAPRAQRSEARALGMTRRRALAPIVALSLLAATAGQATAAPITYTLGLSASGVVDG